MLVLQNFHSFSKKSYFFLKKYGINFFRSQAYGLTCVFIEFEQTWVCDTDFFLLGFPVKTSPGFQNPQKTSPVPSSSAPLHHGASVEGFVQSQSAFN